MPIGSQWFTSAGGLPTSDLYARWRADTGVTESSGAVSSWVDSVNSHNAAEGTNKPLYQTSRVNGEPAILFDGSNDLLQVASGFSLSQPYHVFLCIRQVTHAGSKNFIDGASNARYVQQKGTAPAIVQYSGGAGATNSVSTGVPAAGSTSNFFVLSSFFNGASSYQAADDSTAASGGNPGTGGFSGTLTMGAQNDKSDRFCNYESAELLFYSAEQTTGDLASILAYFKDRYAIPGIT